jgi:uncharacterized protein (DUF1697 family)
MPRYAAFLRGINVVGSRIGGKQLAAPFEALGFEGVQTFRASGNLVFDAPREAAAKMTGRIESALSKGLGLEVAVFLRTASEVAAIARHRPFDRSAVERSKGKLQVVMLKAKPAATVQGKVLAMASDDELLTFGGRELYWLPSGGTRDSSLNFKSIEKLLGSTTIRTMGTVEQMAARYFGD